ncbi:MAG: LD-carboxypeptidase [Bryobacterales bacterium]|nr:LD-carboxypeptidase [Bryobacterales bacterium]
MTRRALVALAAAPVAAQNTSTQLRKPKALQPGDTVAVIMPSTPVPDPDRLAQAARTVEFFGLKLKRGRNLGKRTGAFTDFIDQRVADLHEAFSDPDVRAVFPIGGGYGAMQILDKIDYSIIRRNPKIFTGYSDITAMHLAFNKLAGLVTFHTPMLLSSFTEYSQAYFRRALFDTHSLGRIVNPPAGNAVRPGHPWRTVRPGRARGPIIGGNLTLISTTMGTRYEIDTQGKILVLEDVGEETYSIDRMLTQLWLAGKLQQSAGIVWGECSDCGPGDYKPSTSSPYTLGETVDNILGRLDVPVLAGLTIGHTADQASFPLGVAATLDADAGALIVEDAATV